MVERVMELVGCGSIPGAGVMMWAWSLLVRGEQAVAGGRGREEHRSCAVDGEPQKGHFTIVLAPVSLYRLFCLVGKLM